MLDREPFKYYFFLHFEWIALFAGLLLVVLLDPFSHAPSFCLIDRLGIGFCPGCGLGKSVALAARGHLEASFQSHPLGFFSIVVIVARIGSIFHRNYNLNNEKHNEKNI